MEKKTKNSMPPKQQEEGEGREGIREGGKPEYHANINDDYEVWGVEDQALRDIKEGNIEREIISADEFHKILQDMEENE